MVDFNLAASAIDTLLKSMDGASQVEQYNAYASIITLSHEIEKYYKRCGITDCYVDEKLSELRYYAAHSAGLITNGRSQDLYIRWSSGALKSMISSLELLGFEQK